ncbi:MAG: DUF4136 domain-containing protein [Ginsengibacter sp.]
MKKLLLFAIGFASFIFANAQQVKVGADKSFKASVNGFKTFAWSSEINQIPNGAIFLTPNGVYIFNNESTREKIKKAIKFELNAKGFKETETKPDMLVLFRVSEQPGILHTFNGYEYYDGGMDSTRTPQNKETVKINAGTLLINIMDAKSDKVAWQGYASGILKPHMINNDVKVREAVASIFKRFKFRAGK